MFYQLKYLLKCTTPCRSNLNFVLRYTTKTCKPGEDIGFSKLDARRCSISSSTPRYMYIKYTIYRPNMLYNIVIYMDRVKRIWYVSPMRAAKVQAFAQSRQNLRCSLIQVVNQEEPSDRKPDPWPLWMAGHAQLKFVMTECSKTQIRLMGPKCNCIFMPYTDCYTTIIFVNSKFV